MAEHCRSWYAATANDRRGHPSLAGEQAADVCVIGAGFTGLSAALTLAERGYSVAVVEAQRVGWGASGRNGGQLIGDPGTEARMRRRLGEADADALWALRWRGHEIVEERVRGYAIDCDFRRGYVDVAIKPRQMRDLEADHAYLQQRGFADESRLLGAAEVAELLGTTAYVGGLTNFRNGHLHPLNLCLGEARAAVSRGVRVFEQSPVTRIEHGARPRVVTDRGAVSAEAVLLAGDALHRLEGRRLDGHTFNAGSFIIATAPLPAEARRRINPRDLAVCDGNHLLDYFRLSADGRLLFGGRCNYSGREPASIRRALVPRMLKLYPELRDVAIEYEWGGLVGVVPNRIPLLGRSAPNVYFAQGYSGNGINMSHIAGEIVADAIDGTLARLDLFERIGHRRLPLGRWGGDRLMALALAWYRLRDLL
ncbi:MAG: FAD-binding oxidoreductase [Gammaproteobacteria bacterium]|nr:FAD-binding oxidoreductase [Gammaproteobacteria bacterium]